EHSIVNMFAIPAGMLLGAPVSLGQWWWWNQVPVTLGNIVAGALLTGIALWYTYARKQEYAARPSQARSGVAMAAGD
ncbi:MAG: formate transporter, partial [Acidobacteria bacterium]